MLHGLSSTARVSIIGALMLAACSTGGESGAAGGAPGSSGSNGAASGSANGTGGAAAGTGAGGGGAGTLSAGTGGAAAGAGGDVGGAVMGGAGAGGSGNGGGSAGTTVAGGGGSGGGGGSKSKTTFFVSSNTSKTGKLGGLAGADKRCQDLAKAAGIGDHTFHAYLSTENPVVNAKDRIGTGPWVNANGLKLADDVAALHSAAMKGDHTLFVDELGMPIHGQWDGGPVEHDILTGSKADGTVAAGKTCMDWTSDADNIAATVGHSDGMGPGMATTGNYPSWNSSHDNMSCADTAPRGGAGRIYCFAVD